MSPAPRPATTSPPPASGRFGPAPPPSVGPGVDVGAKLADCAGRDVVVGNGVGAADAGTVPVPVCDPPSYVRVTVFPWPSVMTTVIVPGWNSSFGHGGCGCAQTAVPSWTVNDPQGFDFVQTYVSLSPSGSVAVTL